MPIAVSRVFVLVDGRLESDTKVPKYFDIGPGDVAGALTDQAAAADSQGKWDLPVMVGRGPASRQAVVELPDFLGLAIRERARAEPVPVPLTTQPTQPSLDNRVWIYRDALWVTDGRRPVSL